MLTPIITTKRLNIFRVDLVPSKHNSERAVFLAFRHDIDWPGCAVTMTVMADGGGILDGYVDWIETAETQRRQGLATETAIAVQIYLNKPLVFDGATDGGEKFCEHLHSELERIVGEKGSAQ